MALPFYLLLLLLLPNTGNAVEEKVCLVEEKACDFPFTIDGQEHDGCLADSDVIPTEEDDCGEGSGHCEMENDSKELAGSHVKEQEHYCHVEIGKKYVQGVCDSECFYEDGKTPRSYNEENPLNMAMFCKTKSSACQFPFIWNGVTYTSCTKAGNTEFHWCAVSVDENRNLRDKRWGKCNMQTCNETTVIEVGEGMDDLTLVIIIVLIVVIVLLVVIITALVCYCQKRKQGTSGEKSLSESELDAELFPNDSRKQTLFDELSIPFIDASCPPSPNLKGSYVFTKTGSLRRASKASSSDVLM